MGRKCYSYTEERLLRDVSGAVLKMINVMIADAEEKGYRSLDLQYSCIVGLENKQVHYIVVEKLRAKGYRVLFGYTIDDHLSICW